MGAVVGSRFVDVERGVRVWVKDAGEGRPLVLLHGWPASHRMFEYQFNALAKDVRCIAPDMRGFGDSDHPWNGYDYDRLADDVEAVLDHYDIRDATLAGFSMGGATAVRYLARFGTDRISRLVLMGAAIPRVTKAADFPLGIDRSACDDLIRLCADDRPKMIGAFARQFFQDIDALSPEFQRWFSGLCEEAAGFATMACCALFRDADLRADLAQVTVPTLILHGKDDRICPFPLAEFVQRAIPGSRLVPFEKAGHGFFYEQKTKVNEELRRFVLATGKRISPAAEAPAVH